MLRYNHPMTPFSIDRDYLADVLIRLLHTHSPTGFTDRAVMLVAGELENLGVSFALTRRGAIRVTLKGAQTKGARATVAHLDTLGAMVRELKANGRLAVTPIGTWSPRFAEGARVTVFTDTGGHTGTILPLMASGHTYNEEVDTQPATWDNLEIRVDEEVHDQPGLEAAGLNIGDFVAVHAEPVITPAGFIKSRHLDDKAGVACQLAAIKALVDAATPLPVECHVLFTITEEEGTGASSVLSGEVASMVAVDNSTVAPGQASIEDGVTIAMRDKGGIYDYHLTRKLLRLAQEAGLPHARDVFRHYKSDATAAVAAGNDIRAALVCFGCDASHGWERTHIRSLVATAQLLCAYMASPVEITRDCATLAGLEGFPQGQVCLEGGM